MTSDSRIPGFYKLTLAERREELARRRGLDAQDVTVLDQGGLALADADRMVENALGVYGLPLGVGLNFRVNGRDYTVPMAVEEPSVIAAASNAARMVRAGGGFCAEADASIMTGQVELLGVRDPEGARARVLDHADELRALAATLVPRLVARGGGLRDLEVRVLAGHNGTGTRVVVHLYIDCGEAMGANLVNTIAEGMAGRLAKLAGGRPGLRILSNLCDRRRVRVRAQVPFEALGSAGIDGAHAAREIAQASRFAEDDPYRAATHNKGIMNGVDAVVLATGNDWRGVEAGAHAFAAMSGRYRPLCTWQVPDDARALHGFLEMPLAIGTVGGTLGVHAGARLAHKLLGVETAGELAKVIASAGMASNLAALRALATEGIQRGHMACHRRATGAPAVTPPGSGEGEGPAERAP